MGSRPSKGVWTGEIHGEETKSGNRLASLYSTTIADKNIVFPVQSSVDIPHSQESPDMCTQW